MASRPLLFRPSGLREHQLLTNSALALAIALLATVLVVGVSPTGAAAADAARTVSGPLVPPGDKVLLGAYVEARGDFTDADRRASVEAHEESIGRSLDIANEFFSFSKPWRLDRLQWHIDEGRIPMVSWNGTHADDILAGRHDDLIRQRANDAKSLEETFLLRFFWEVDAAKGKDWGYHEDPTLYHRVWAHIRSIFDQEGVDNALWVWTPTTWHFTTGEAASFYPGDDLVDWIGADGYQWACRDDGLETFGQVYEDFLGWAAGRNKPIIAAEWGADEGPGKVPFIESVPETLAAHPNIVAMVAFDSIDPGGRGCNFRIDSSAPALDAYRALVNAAPFVEAAVPEGEPVDTTVPEGLPRVDDPPLQVDPSLDLRAPLWFSRPLASQGTVAMLVVGEGDDPDPADGLVIDRLKALGLDVLVVDDDDLGPVTGPEASVILVSATVSSKAVGEKLSWRPTPIMVWKPWLYDDMWLTDPDPDVSFGTVLAGPTRHAIEDRDLSVVEGGRVPFVQPAPGGHVIIETGGAPVLVRWNEGNELAGRRLAPACRSTFFGYHSTMDALTGEGWAQFDQNLNWMLTDCQR